MSSYDMILVETQGPTGVIRLNRPAALNALCDQLMTELGQALRAYDADTAIFSIIITGSEKAFAAGADIKEMKDRTYPAVYLNDFIGANWEVVPTLGGGCELAMMCDFIIAAENAKFGQPEINLGIIPGAGGTQRLTRAVGKAKAMDLCLTARMMDAAEAERSGLVARVVPLENLMAEALKVGEKLASLSQPALAMAKESVNRAFETTLAEGVKFERRLFHSMFATDDQKEGMSAFAEKRRAQFRHS